MESAVPNQIAYGYDYSPQRHAPPSTWDFARDYYPYMRFGLAFTLMGDGYFSHELGDTDHGQDWWYDELDFKLGEPLGPAQQIVLRPAADRELLENGGFENELGETWRLWCDQKSGCAATVQRDTGGKHAGLAAACITITGAGRRGGIELSQSRRSLEHGKAYDLTFWARADRPMNLMAIASKGSPNWDNYGLSQDVRLSTKWQAVKLTFEAKRTAQDRADPVPLRRRNRQDLDRRSLAQGTRRGDIPTRFPERHRAAQRHEASPDRGRGRGLRAAEGPTGARSTSTFWMTAKRKPSKRRGHGKTWRWGRRSGMRSLPITTLGTIAAISWPAARARQRGTSISAGGRLIRSRPGGRPRRARSSGQSKRSMKLVADGKVVASKTLDQSQEGDQWHAIVERLELDPGSKPLVRIKSADGGILVADALHVFSVERYNDGEAVRQVNLEPMDGIVLRRIGKT